MFCLNLLLQLFEIVEIEKNYMHLPCVITNSCLILA
jgi:hypothetical protein